MSKPIKRDKRLVPLSHDHHTGLLFAWKLKQGTARQADLTTMKDYIVYFWESDMQQHFSKEEELLIPHLDPGNEQRKRVLQEHNQIKALINECTNDPDYEKIKTLGQSVHDHIRFEEREFFPFMEKTLSDEQLDTIGEILHQTPEFCDNWQPEFWK